MTSEVMELRRSEGASTVEAPAPRREVVRGPVAPVPAVPPRRDQSRDLVFSQVKQGVYVEKTEHQRRGSIAGVAAGGGLAGLFGLAAVAGYADVGVGLLAQLGDFLWQVIAWGVPILIVVGWLLAKLKRR